MRPYTLLALRPVLDLGIAVGDVLIVEPGAIEPVVLQRQVWPNYRRILREIETGALEPTNPSRPWAELAAVVSPPWLVRLK